MWKKVFSPEDTVNWRCAYIQQKLWKEVRQPSKWWMPF